MAEKLEELEQHLEMLIENSRQLGIIASDFQPQGQNVLNGKIHSLVQEMQEIDRLKNCVHDIQVPIGVFEYIDQGKNPQLYTKDSMEKALQKNEEVKGKSESLDRFRGLLMCELSKSFESEMNRYRAARDPNRPQ
ncbi:mediator of RNA polymerase II transcription subunit 10-like [Watersipora subatra]|uniref:mediator of RNA polymerase II transcription subunit 10-like n=1 Tax=Watersipora subatra TaxID=2589382 RepID=UPI00355BEFFF